MHIDRIYLLIYTYLLNRNYNNSQSEIYRRGNVGIHRPSVDLSRRPSSAFQSFPIISNEGSVAFPMLALVENARDSVL